MTDMRSEASWRDYIVNWTASSTSIDPLQLVIVGLGPLLWCCISTRFVSGYQNLTSTITTDFKWYPLLTPYLFATVPVTTVLFSD